MTYKRCLLLLTVMIEFLLHGINEYVYSEDLGGFFHFVSLCVCISGLITSFSCTMVCTCFVQSNQSLFLQIFFLNI